MLLGVMYRRSKGFHEQCSLDGRSPKENWLHQRENDSQYLRKGYVILTSIVVLLHRLHVIDGVQSTGIFSD